MAYNLNYNPGVEYENQRRHRKVLIILISILVLLVLVIFIYLGFRNNQSEQNQALSPFDELSGDQKQALLRSMSAEGTTTVINEGDDTELLQGMSAKEGPSGGGDSQNETISGLEKENLIKSMSAN